MTAEEIIALAVADELPGYCCLYDPASGEIVTVVMVRDAGAVPAGLGFYLGDADPVRHYIVDNQRVDRPRLEAQSEYEIAANGTDEVSFQIPAGTRILFGDQWHVSEEDEPFAFTTVVPGEATFVVRAPFPWISTTVKVTAR